MLTNGLPIPPMQAVADRLITIAAAREQIGVSRSKLYQLLAENLLPQPVKLGRRSYFSEREVQAFIHALLEGRTAGRRSDQDTGSEAQACRSRRSDMVAAAIGSSKRNSRGGR